MLKDSLSTKGHTSKPATRGLAPPWAVAVIRLSLARTSKCSPMAAAVGILERCSDGFLGRKWNGNGTITRVVEL